jgi:hypothetical protein
MEHLRYLGVAMVAFLGLLAGITLGAVAREEVVHGRRWLLLLKKGIYVLLLATLLYYHHGLLEAAAILIAGGAGYLVMGYRGIYSLLGATLGMVYASPALLPAAVLVFLFGLPMGSLMASTRKHAKLWRMLWSTLRRTWWVYIPPAALIPLLLRL